MLTMTRFAKPRSLCGAALLWLAAAALSASAAGAAFAAEDQAPAGAAATVQPAPVQQAPPQPAPPVAAAPSMPPQPPPVNKSGLLHELGRWWNGSIGFLGDKMKDARGKFEDLGKKSGDAAKGAAVATQEGMKKTLDVSKDAATTLLRLPNTRVIEVHASCEKAPNGAPDCATAAASVCRGRGFNGGQPLDVRTAEKCDTTQAWQAGQSPGKGECPIESWITRAVCQ
jgi:hypothetical protein